MKKVLKIDENGFFIEDVILTDEEETPSNCIEIHCQEGLYKPKWNGKEWIEGATEEFINSAKNQPQEPSQLDLTMLAIAQLDSQREQDKLETQLAIAELANSLLGGVN